MNTKHADAKKSIQLFRPNTHFPIDQHLVADGFIGGAPNPRVSLHFTRGYKIFRTYGALSTKFDLSLEEAGW